MLIRQVGPQNLIIKTLSQSHLQTSVFYSDQCSYIIRRSLEIIDSTK